jgi:hypothetical protein
MSDNGVRFKGARCLRCTGKAIQVESPDLEQSPAWIPQSQVHDDSEVWKAGDEGVLVVTTWYAEQKGWT